MEHDLPDELISANEPGLVNGGDLNQLHTTLGGGPGGLGPGGGSGGPGGGMGFGLGPGGGAGGIGGGQDAVAKHKQLSELLRSGAPTSTPQGHQGALVLNELIIQFRMSKCYISCSFNNCYVGDSLNMS